MATESLQGYRLRAFNCLYDASIQAIDRLNRHIDELNFPGTPQRVSESHYQTFRDLVAIADRFRSDRGCWGTPAVNEIMDATNIILPHTQEVWRHAHMGLWERMAMALNPMAIDPAGYLVAHFRVMMSFAAQTVILNTATRQGRGFAHSLCEQGRISKIDIPKAGFRFGAGRFMTFEGAYVMFNVVVDEFRATHGRQQHIPYPRTDKLRRHVDTLTPPQ